MNAVATGPAADRGPVIRQHPRPDLAGTLRAELAVTLHARSSRWLLAAAAALPAGLATAFNLLALSQAASVSADHAGGPEYQPIPEVLGISDPTSISLLWLLAGLLPMMAFGAVACIRGWRDEVLTGTPARRTLVAARVITVAVIALPAGEVISLASFFLGELGLGLTVTGNLARAADLRAVAGGGLFLGAGAMLGFGLAALQRAIAPGASRRAVLVMTFLAWVASWVAEALPAPVGQWFPFRAGLRIISTSPGPGFSPWIVLAVFCAATAVIVVAGLASGTVVRRRFPGRWLSNRGA